MIGWLFAGWFIALILLATAWFNTRWSKMQRRVASQRPSMDSEAYAQALTVSGVSPTIANTLYRVLQANCVKSVLPHPDDGLMGFYFDDPEDMEDLIEQLVDELGLERAARYDPEASPHLGSARELALFLQLKMSQVSSAQTD